METPTIKFSKEKPEIYEELHNKLKVDWDDDIIICYGDTIHCKVDISPEKVVHEVVHVKQQKKIGRDEWWRLYLDMPQFRLEQEIEAYTEEYKFIKRNIKNKEIVFKKLIHLAKDLSSKTYGDIITTDDAMSIILKNSK